MKKTFICTVAVVMTAIYGFRQFNISSASSDLADKANIIHLAESFKATLGPDQLSKLEIPLTKAASVKWTNIPGGASVRNGLQFSTLNPEQLAAAKAVIRAASGNKPNEGFDEFMQIGLADDIISKSGRPGYGSGEYIIAFLGKPDAVGTWMLQFGGHHYAQNVVFNKGIAVSATPIFEGGDPREWTTAGKKYAPLFQEHEAITNMLAALSVDELKKARSDEKITDVMLGTTQDGKFPSVKAGISVGSLSPEKKKKVIAAMMPWLDDIETGLARKLLKSYSRELDQTYISLSGNMNAVAGQPETFLQNIGDYARIDGPSVWIEFACQAGVYSKMPHYHTVFRDHRLDYNNLWDF